MFLKRKVLNTIENGHNSSKCIDTSNQNAKRKKIFCITDDKRADGNDAVREHKGTGRGK